MTIKRVLPSVIFIALTSATYVYIASVLNISAMWLPFISWSAYFIVGGQPSSIPKIIYCFTGGMIVGLLTVALSTGLSNMLGNNLALAITVFFMVVLILLTELVKSVDMIPIYFFGYSSFFAYYYGKFGGDATVLEIIPFFWFLLMVGLGLGYFTAEGRKRILRLQGTREKKVNFPLL